jgi:hypothetical protein
LSIYNLGKIKKGLASKISQVELRDLLALLSITVVACLIGGIFQLVYFGWPFNQYLSWSANDLPAVRPGAIKIQMNFGVHYFSDLLQPLDWARQANPWTSDPKYLAQYPPVAIYILKPLTIFPYRIATFIYLILMVASSIIGIWLLSKKLMWSNKVLIVLVFGISSVPFLMAFDRGNLVGFFALLFSLFVYGVTKKNKYITWISLGLMISIKIYPVMLILVLFRLKRYKEAIYSIVFALAGSLFLFAITPGNFQETISQFVAANLGGFDIQGDRQIRTFANFIHIFIDAPDAILQSWKYARETNVIFNIFRISLLVASVLIVLLKSKLRLSALLLLSCIAMTTLNSSQLGYNWFWAPIFIVWLISERSIKVGDNDVFPTNEVWKTENYAVITAVGFCLLSLPTGLHVPGSNTPLTPYIGVLTCFVAILFMFLQPRESTSQKRETLAVNNLSI